jgi:hypothetical protein
MLISNAITFVLYDLCSCGLYLSPPAVRLCFTERMHVYMDTHSDERAVVESCDKESLMRDSNGSIAETAMGRLPLVWWNRKNAGSASASSLKRRCSQSHCTSSRPGCRGTPLRVCAHVGMHDFSSEL